MSTIVSSSASHNPQDAPNAYDGNATTRWTSGIAMQLTMYFQAEFAGPVMIGGIDARAADNTDNPAKWTVAVMDSDGGHGRREMATGSGPIVATWPAERAQVVRIECTSSDDFYWWSIAELSIDAMDIVEPPPVEPPVELPVVDEEVGPAVFPETLARYWVQRWAARFGWPIRQRDGVDFTTRVVTVEQSVSFVVARARAQGILTPWPFTESEGG